ncbi:serine protease [Streptomyces sp. AJS327]|uniref:S1 family peptidase n=1 Tax=Streptomyces sp. AJS327 TaxID=2545265 RepID=UPI0015E01B49|nr:serine protease [Streptomyces sp. AJS327]MBA0051323.1 serine protease [Streptomyces sp. AJS327]
MSLSVGRSAKRAIVVGAALALAAVMPGAAQADPASDGPKPTIIGGEPTTTEEHPYTMALTDTSGRQFCGGTLVAPNKVVTAAHCVDGDSPGSVNAVGGRTDMTTDEGTSITTSDIWVHPDYGSAGQGADVAVLTLEEEMPYEAVPFVSADETDVYEPGSPATILGWGATSEGGSTSDVLLKAEVPTVSDEDCSTAYGDSFNAEDMVCAGLEEGGVDACQGDSGGPLILNGKLAGMTSWGEGCARPGKPGVYGKMTAFSDLVKEQVES